VKVLGLDTATHYAGIAIVDSERGVLAQAAHDGSARSADLLVAIDAMCKAASIPPGELDAVAIGAGPGSFTGLRIGMATAKGIAFAAGVPLWAVSSLAALAWGGHAEVSTAGIPRADGVYVGALDARRGEVFAGCYRVDADSTTLIGEERVMPPGELAGWVERVTEDPAASFCGDALAAHAETLRPLAHDWLLTTTPSGIAIAWLALAGPRTDVLTSGAPTYIRPSEAEVMYPDGVPGALRRRDP